MFAVNHPDTYLGATANYRDTTSVTIVSILRCSIEVLEPAANFGRDYRTHIELDIEFDNRTRYRVRLSTGNTGVKFILARTPMQNYKMESDP